MSKEFRETVFTILVSIAIFLMFRGMTDIRSELRSVRYALEVHVNSSGHCD